MHFNLSERFREAKFRCFDASNSNENLATGILYTKMNCELNKQCALMRVTSFSSSNEMSIGANK